MLKQLAHSPPRPLLDCSSAQTSPYLGNLSSALQSVLEQRYDSTLAAPRAASSGVGGVNPFDSVGDPQTVQGGLLTNWKKLRLNHLKEAGQTVHWQQV